MNQQVRISNPRHRLARVLEAIEERSFDDLVTTSQDRLGRLEGAIRNYVDGQMTALLKLQAQGEVAIIRRAPELAMNIAEVAGAAGQAATSETARGLRAVIDSLVGGGAWRGDALNLHIAALALLNRKVQPPPDAVETMLHDLRALRTSIGVEEQDCADGVYT